MEKHAGRIRKRSCEISPSKTDTWQKVESQGGCEQCQGESQDQRDNWTHTNQQTGARINKNAVVVQDRQERERDMVIQQLKKEEDFKRVQKAVQKVQQGQWTTWDCTLE